MCVAAGVAVLALRGAAVFFGTCRCAGVTEVPGRVTTVGAAVGIAADVATDVAPVEGAVVVAVTGLITAACADGAEAKKLNCQVSPVITSCPCVVAVGNIVPLGAVTVKLFAVSVTVTVRAPATDSNFTGVKEDPAVRAIKLNCHVSPVIASCPCVVTVGKVVPVGAARVKEVAVNVTGTTVAKDMPVGVPAETLPPEGVLLEVACCVQLPLAFKFIPGEQVHVLDVLFHCPPVEVQFVCATDGCDG